MNRPSFSSRSLALALALGTATPAAAAFNPVEFFRGSSHGTGTLKVVFQSPVTIHVESLGTVEKDGTLLLKQVIHEPRKPARTRFWRMRQEGPERFVGTLTDAVGPVRVDVNATSVRIRYTGQNHLAFDQVLTPAGPRLVRNAMRVKRFGIVVAHFNEVIRKTD